MKVAVDVNAITKDVDEERMAEELKKFNWGALVYTWIWGMFNGARSKVLLNVLILLISIYTYTELKSILYTEIVLAVFVFTAMLDGCYGNRWAWYGTRPWEDFDTFVAYQKKWGRAACILLLICAYGVGSYIGYSYYKYNTTEISPYGRGKIIAESYVQKIMNISKSMKLQCGKDIVDVLMNEYLSNDNPSQNRKIVRRTSSMFRIESSQYVSAFSFYKEPSCDLGKKNCFIYYYEGLGQAPVQPYSKTYYDDYGKVKTVMIRQ